MDSSGRVRHTLEKGLGVSVERDGVDRRNVPPSFLQNISHYLPCPESSL